MGFTLAIFCNNSIDCLSCQSPLLSTGVLNDIKLPEAMCIFTNNELVLQKFSCEINNFHVTYFIENTSTNYGMFISCNIFAIIMEY